MILLIFRTIFFCCLISLLLGCAALHLPTMDGSSFEASEDDSPASRRWEKKRSLSTVSSRDGDETDTSAVEEKTEKEEKTPEQQDTTLQEVPGPRADDELLDLWKKDIDQAMQQPSGQRKIKFSLPVVQNQRVHYFLDVFRGRQREFFERALARSGKYIPMMAGILREEGLPEGLVYLSMIESGFSPHAYSRAKAVGPWQFIRGTARRYGLKIDSWVDERKDPVLSTRAAAAYLKDLHEQFGEWFLAAAAYNAGAARVGRAVRRSKTNDFWHLSRTRRYLKLETRNYVPKFIAAAIIATEPEKHGFADVAYEAPLQYDEVTIETPLRLQTVAVLAATSVNHIKELNPALLRNFTPPGNNGFKLRLPVGTGEAFSRGYKRLPDSAKIKLALHRVKKGDSLGKIAGKYGMSVKRLMESNGLKSGRIRVGQELIIMLPGAAKKK